MNQSIKKATINTISRASGAGLSMLLALLIARVGGTEVAGYYYTYTAVITFLVVGVVFGDQPLLLRSVSLMPDKGKSIVQDYMAIYLRRGAVLIVLVWLVTTLLPFSVLGMSSFVWLVLSSGALMLSIIQAFGNYYNGLNRQLTATFFQAQAMPLSMLASAFFLMGYIVNEPYRLGLWMAVSYGVIAILFMSITRMSVFSASVEHTRFVPQQDSMKVMSSVLLTHLGNWAPTFIILVFSTQSDVGVFNTSLKLTIMATLIAGAMAALSAPQFAKTFCEEELQALVDNNIRLCLLFSVLGLVPILILDEWILGLFGQDFLRGRDALWILVIGKLVAMCFGTVGHLLLQRGLYSQQIKSILIGVTVQFLFAIVLIPYDPVIGAAIAVAVGILVESLAQALFVRRSLGVLCFIVRFV